MFPTPVNVEALLIVNLIALMIPVGVTTEKTLAELLLILVMGLGVPAISARNICTNPEGLTLLFVKAALATYVLPLSELVANLIVQLALIVNESVIIKKDLLCAKLVASI